MQISSYYLYGLGSVTLFELRDMQTTIYIYIYRYINIYIYIYRYNYTYQNMHYINAWFGNNSNNIV